MAPRAFGDDYLDRRPTRTYSSSSRTPDQSGNTSLRQGPKFDDRLQQEIPLIRPHGQHAEQRDHDLFGSQHFKGYTSLNKYRNLAGTDSQNDKGFPPKVMQRRSSVDHGEVNSSERPVSVLDATFGTQTNTKDVGPPASTRGWDKIDGNLRRATDVWDTPQALAAQALDPSVVYVPHRRSMLGHYADHQVIPHQRPTSISQIGQSDGGSDVTKNPDSGLSTYSELEDLSAQDVSTYDHDTGMSSDVTNDHGLRRSQYCCFHSGCTFTGERKKDVDRHIAVVHQGEPLRPPDPGVRPADADDAGYQDPFEHLSIGQEGHARSQLYDGPMSDGSWLARNHATREKLESTAPKPLTDTATQPLPSVARDLAESSCKPTIKDAEPDVAAEPLSTNPNSLAVVEGTIEEMILPEIRSLEEEGEAKEIRGLRSHPSGTFPSPAFEYKLVSDDDSTYVESIVSLAPMSIASTASTLIGDAVSDEVIKIFVQALLYNESLSELHLVALQDPAIGALKLRQNLSRLIRHYGNDLRNEARDKDEVRIARLLRQGNLASRAALSVADHTEESQRPLAKPQRKPQIDDDDEEEDDSESASDEEYEDPGLSKEDFMTAIQFLAGSDAYIAFKERLFDFVHRPHRRRLLRALGDDIFGTSGTKLHAESMKATAYELSFAPSHVFALSEMQSTSIADTAKGWIEDSMGETWDWWPLEQRRHSTPKGCSRLSWTSPSGESQHIHLPTKAAESALEVIKSGQVFYRMAMKQGDSNTKTSSSSISSQPTRQEPSSPTNGATPMTNIRSSASSPTPSPVTSHVQGTQFQAQQIMPVGHVFLCVKTGSSYRFSDIKTHAMCSDADFFRTLKSEYIRLRGWYRRCFCISQYDRCDFFRFHKYPFGEHDEGAPQRIGFPSQNDREYNFDPCPIEPYPPGGPISDHEFRSRFHKSCDQCHSWHLWHKHKMSGRIYSQSAIARLPKRDSPLNMKDGKRELFWGIYARERRSAFRVVAYGSLTLVGSVVFFFLWLFYWNHGADLQNAAVPVGLSLSLTTLYVALLYGSREDEVG